MGRIPAVLHQTLIINTTKGIQAYWSKLVINRFCQYPNLLVYISVSTFSRGSCLHFSILEHQKMTENACLDNFDRNWLCLFIPIMCRNDELSWFFTKWFRVFFILFAENSQIFLKNSVVSILLTFIYLVALNLFVNNQLNSSLRHIIVTNVNKRIHFRWQIRRFLVEEFMKLSDEFYSKQEN